MKFWRDDRPPLLTAEEAERAGAVLVQGADGLFYLADTVIDPETGGVYAVPQDGVKGNRIEIEGV